MKKYTQKEILQNIETLKDKEDKALRERKSINERIRSIRKQIESWEELNENQYKMF